MQACQERDQQRVPVHSSTKGQGVTAPMPTEAQCQSAIMKAAKLAGWRCHASRTSRTNDGRYVTAVQGDTGWPDCVFLKPGRMVVVEFKRDKGSVMQPGQEEWIDMLDTVPGVQAMVVYVPSDQERLIKALQRNT